MIYIYVGHCGVGLLNDLVPPSLKCGFSMFRNS